MTDIFKIPEESFIFIDSNIFTYFLLRDHIYFESCSRFLKNVESGDIIGFINNIVITETLFNFVKAEICKKHKIKPKDFIHFIKTHPESIGGVDISDVMDVFSISKPESGQCSLKLHYAAGSLSLLSNDAFHLLTMKYLKITNIATNDSDFDRINGIKIWKP